MNDTEVTKVAGRSGPRISTGPAGRSLFSLTGPTVNILATGQRLRRPLHETDEAASSQEESAHIAAQNIESEATRNAENQSEKCNNNTEKSSSDNQSETGNTDSTNNSTKEIDINVTTELFMKKL